MALLLALLLSTYARPEMLVETDWLASHLSDPSVRVVDLRVRGYEDGHIPGAVHLRNEQIRDASHQDTFVPSAADFEAIMGRLGISSATRVIAYDDRGGIYAARLWWILNYYGHANVALLNGGWLKWSKESRAVSADAPALVTSQFVARPDPRWIATAEDVKAAIDQPGVRIVDARTAAEIDGTDLRGIRRGGRIPSSVAVYWEDALEPDVKTFKPAAELEKLYRDKDIRPTDEVIAYCQVGMRASHDLFVLRLIGFDKLRNYYPAWEQWGNSDELPIVKPPDR